MKKLGAIAVMAFFIWKAGSLFGAGLDFVEHSPEAKKAVANIATSLVR
jgi:hypothetical protein